jgi:hypothetical protein
MTLGKWIARKQGDAKKIREDKERKGKKQKHRK